MTACPLRSLAGDHGPCGPLESLLKPDVTQDSPSSETSSAEREPGPKKSRARERRREGRSKTFDWAEFRPIAQALAQQRAQEADALQAELGELERSKRREERRKRYESATGPPLETAADGGGMDVESSGTGRPRPPSPERQQRVQDEIEQRWQQVESTPIRDERQVPLPSALQGAETTELEKLLESYKKGVSPNLVPGSERKRCARKGLRNVRLCELKWGLMRLSPQVEELKLQLESCHSQLSDSNHHKLELENRLRTALEREQQVRSGYISPVSRVQPSVVYFALSLKGKCVAFIFGDRVAFFPLNFACLIF